MTKTQKIIYYVLLVLISGLFLFAAYPKFTAAPMEVEAFTAVHLPIWFMYFIAVCEVLGVIGLWLAKFQKWAVWGLQIIMIGAFVVTWIEMGFLFALLNVAVFVILYFIMRLGAKKNAMGMNAGSMPTSTPTSAPAL